MIAMGSSSSFLKSCWFLWMMPYAAVQCYSLADAHRLKEELFKNRTYDPSFRPLMNQSELIQVSIHMRLSEIYDIDLNNGHLKAGGYLYLSWQDHQLQWNASLYGGMDLLAVSTKDIWNPTMTQDHDFSLTLPFSKAWVMSNGRVDMVEVGHFVMTCGLNMWMYPVDKHICDVSLVSASADGTELQLISTSNRINTQEYTPNGKWDLLGTEAYVTDAVEIESGVPYSLFNGKISIQRKPAFVIMHTTLPSVLLFCVNVFVSLVPIQGGERVSFSVTLFLTMIYFSIHISENLPQTSTRVSLMSINITILLIVSGLWVVTSIVLCKLAEDSDEKIQPWLQKLTVAIVHLRRKHRNVADGMSATDSKVTNISAVELDQNSEKNDIVSCSDSDHSPADLDENALTWAMVAGSMDYALFRIGLILVFLYGLVTLILFTINLYL